jgi:Carboxypeptidase regulatory-like domain
VVLKRFAVLLAIIISTGIGVLAQDAPQQDMSSGVRLAGQIRTAGGIPVPGATVRVIQTSSGRAWISWTDENGKFELPSLPEGHYQLEATQLGFAPATKEFDLKAGSNAPVELKVDVETLTALAGNANSPQAASTVPAETRGNEPASRRATGGTPQGPGGAGPTGQPPTQQGARRFPGRGGFGPNGPPAGPGGELPGGAQPGFQQVGLNRNAQGPGVPNDTEAAAPEEGPLGQASSSDAFLMSGTVARSAAPDLSVVAYGGPREGGPGLADQEAPAGIFGGGGGPGGAEGGGGGAVFIARGGGGGRGPVIRGGGRRGPGGPQGVGILWGAARVRRQRINSIHYSLYDTYSTSALNARPYSLAGTTPAKIASWQERFGGNVGGPLKIPHVYDGTDKTFFFVNYELGWSRDPVDQFATVPTDAERGGNFTDRGVQLFDPVTHAPLGGSIPATMQNSAALGLLAYIPRANLPGLVNNFHLQTRVPGATNRLNFLVVHTFSSRFHLMVNYHLSDGHSHAFQSFPALESNQDTRGQSFTLGLTQNWTRTFLHDSRLYYSRNRSQALNQFAFNTDIAGQLGINSANGGVSTAPIDYGVPQLGFTNFSGASDPVPSLTRNQTFRYVDSFVIMKSKHTIKTGFEVRKIDTNVRTDPTPRGAFTFDGLLTALIGSNGLPISGTGFDFADFLLGLPQATTIRFGASSTYFRSWGYAAYAQDDWHVAPRFTLQYGIRYEATTPPLELNNRIANLDVSPDFTQAQVVTPGGTAPYSGTLPRSLLRGDYNNWSPRIGFAWQPPGKWFTGRNQTTIRAGYGIFYNGSIYGQLDAAMANQPPFAQAQTLQNGPATQLTFSNAFPPAPASVVSNTVAVNPDYRVGYAQIWNFSIERPLAPNTVLNLTYTGTKGSHLDLLLGLSRTPVPGQPGTGAVQNALGFTYDTSGASSIYHGLQVRVLRRFNHGLMINGTYTYSKSIDNASSIGGGQQVIAQDSSDPPAERGLSSFDMRHQLRIGYMYELPFGDRKRWANGGWTRSIFGGLRFSGSLTAHSGSPFTARVFSGSCSVVGGMFSERANQVGDPNLPASQRTTVLWFNTAAFSLPTGCIGDASRNSITGPGLLVWNAALSKTIPLGRDGLRRIDFRINSSNLLNHPNYTGLSTVVNSATFGSVTDVGSMRSFSITSRVNF